RLRRDPVGTGDARAARGAQLLAGEPELPPRQGQALLRVQQDDTTESCAQRGGAVRAPAAAGVGEGIPDVADGLAGRRHPETRTAQKPRLSGSLRASVAVPENVQRTPAGHTLRDLVAEVEHALIEQCVR